jgi:chlorobactene glucosyltransferase
MQLTLIVLGILSGLELLLWTPLFWRWRRPLAAILLVALALVSGALAGVDWHLWTAAIVCLSLYRAVNLLKVVDNRAQVDYLYNTSHRTSWWLIGLQAGVLVLAGLLDSFSISASAWLYLLAAIQFLVSLVLVSTTSRHLRNTKPPKIASSYADRDLPSLTVAIPARNETADLETCLQSLITSTYPKLEILVLDDCSQDKRTPEIIRGFAHDGVRFVAGKVAPSHWLAKNYAYAQLAEEANGDVLLFCGVDIVFQTDSLRLMVETLMQKKKNMLSIIPLNILPERSRFYSMLVQPARYAWELALPRRLFGRTPVLSTCWLVRRQALEKAGGFEAATRKVIPEGYLADRIAAHEDGYSFLQSGTKMGISSHKSFREQLATAVRTRYPQLHRRPELVALVGLAEFGSLVLPLILLLGALISRAWLVSVFLLPGYLLTNIMYSKIVNLTYRKFILQGLWLLPIAALYDIGILNYSMWQYEFREVIWKGRNVCIPLMRVIPGLPKDS